MNSAFISARHRNRIEQMSIEGAMHSRSAWPSTARTPEGGAPRVTRPNLGHLPIRRADKRARTRESRASLLSRAALRLAAVTSRRA